MILPTLSTEPLTNKTATETRPPNMEEGRPRNWLKISCIGCIGLPIAAVLLTACAVKCQVNRIGDTLPNELAALRKMGVPTEPADLLPNPPIPDRENAKFLLTQLITDQEALKENKPYQATITAYGRLHGNPPESDATVLKGISFVASSLKKLDGISRYKRLDFHRDATQGADLTFPEFAPLKQLVKWQAVRSRFMVKQGRFPESLAAIQSVFVLSRLVADEPYLMSAFAAMNMDAMAHAALSNHLIAIQSNVPALQQARTMLESIKGEIDILRSFSGELVLNRVSAQKLRSWQVLYGNCYTDENGNYPATSYPPEQDPIDRLTFGDPAVRKMFEAKFLQAWRKAHSLMPAASSDWKGIQNAINTVAQSIEDDKSVVNYLNTLLFPAIGGSAKNMGLYQARYRLSLLAIRLLQDRPNGLPTDLTKYGDLAIDPMDGKSIRYDRKGNGFKIWSIGSDETDNHGTKYYPYTGMKNQNVDEVLYFFYPEKAPPLTKYTTPPHSAATAHALGR